MKNIAEECIERIDKGQHFIIDFVKRSLRIGKEMLIENGKTKEGYENYEFDDEEKVELLEKLYLSYKYSRPAEKEYGHYFRCLNADELTDEELIGGDNREKSRFWLEYYVLSEIILGWKWDELTDPKHWFWESKNVEGLVILRDWFTESEVA